MYLKSGCISFIPGKLSALILPESALMAMDEAWTLPFEQLFSFVGTFCSSEHSELSTLLHPGPLTAYTVRHKKWSAVGHKSESGDAASDAISLAFHITSPPNTSFKNRLGSLKPISSLEGLRRQQSAISGKNKKSSDDTWLPVTHPACICVPNKCVVVCVKRSYFKKRGWPSRKHLCLRA